MFSSFSVPVTRGGTFLNGLKSVNLAQLSLADMLALQRLLPNHEKALSWLPGSLDVEWVRWINGGLEKAWPFFKEASSGLIKVKLETVYNMYRVGAIKEISIGNINLGKFCPFVQGIKALPNNEDNQCCLEIQLDWRQNEDQDMLLHVSTTGPEFVVQVKNFVIYCVIRLTFTPLMQELPCFGAVVLSIIEPPLVDFQTKFISGDVKKMPGMVKAVDNILLSALMDLFVWPGRVVMPVLPGDYSDLQTSSVGHLHVQLIEARDLANKDITGSSDPYVVLFVRRRADLIKQSTKMHDTVDPVWNEQFLFSIEDLKVQRLTIKLMNLDEYNLDVFVGIAELEIHQLKANIVEDLWIDLVGDPAKLNERVAGKIHLMVEFKPKTHTWDENDTGNLSFRMGTPSAATSMQIDGRLNSYEGNGQSVMNRTSEDGAISRGLGVLLAGNSTVSEDKDFRVITRNDAVTSLKHFSNIETQRLLTTIADVKVRPQELVGHNKNSTYSEESTLYVKDGGNLQNASIDGVAVAECLESFESERQQCPLLIIEGTGSQEGINQMDEETCTAAPTEKSRKACIAENDSCGDVDIDEETTDQYNVNMGDPAWGLNGLPLKHCNTLAIHEDMFSSEIFETSRVSLSSLSSLYGCGREGYPVIF
ncbi:hypothetical protein GOP47_0019515 [Adiantum capillus-veneris]|uniref:Uncharacterized protein n=1 Tax=Adiantum capillus-veneris TaxID=13818 RepID=A0A9D4UBG2_ADICA|nr:hypothetical protein GOP47_0019515 [Adiantum capillus-veneris]